MHAEVTTNAFPSACLEEPRHLFEYFPGHSAFELFPKRNVVTHFRFPTGGTAVVPLPEIHKSNICSDPTYEARIRSHMKPV